MNKVRSASVIGVALVSFIAGMLAAAPVALLGQENRARTYYESLDLESPLDAVDTFVDAFQREDFVTVCLVLSPDAQFRIQQYINLLNYDKLFQSDAMRQVMDAMPRIEDFEHFDLSYLFDVLTLAAIENDGLLIDLRREVEILGSEPSQTSSGDPAVDVRAVVEGIDGKVIFRTVTAPSGRWRVQQVIVPGGDVEQIPWSVPKS